jgi:hypothetical protein
MQDTILHEPIIGHSGSGAAMFGPPVSYVARVARKQRTVIGKSGEIAVSRSQVWIAAPIVVNFGDRFRLPDGTVTTSILAIDGLPDDAGNVYTKVYL